VPESGVVQAMCQIAHAEGDVPAVGRFRTVKFFAGGSREYLCAAHAAEHGQPDDEAAVAFALANGWKQNGQLWLKPAPPR
jgi:hypothetical protein